MSAATTRPGALETAIAVFVRIVALLLPFLVGAGVWCGGVLAFSGVFVVFGLLTLVEIVLEVTGVRARSLPGQDEVQALNVWPRAQLWFYAVGHLAVVPFVVVGVALGRLGTMEMIGAGLSLASMGGTVGGLGGHELMHKRPVVDRFLGTAVYAMSGYGHFIASHVGGHHVNVGRRDDWGTARRGETLYGFLYRAVFHGFAGGVRIEAERLRRRGSSAWSLDNVVLRCSLASVVGLVLIGHFGGLRTLAFFLATSTVTVAFMELFNYISHYGLERDETGAVIRPEHTWESDNKVVNWFIFNAGMHCAHHQKPAHGFDRLHLFHEKDYIPYGIAGMAVLSFLAPLYLRKMERVLGASQETSGPEVGVAPAPRA